jgi:hypothetical protein
MIEPPFKSVVAPKEFKGKNLSVVIDVLFQAIVGMSAA